ncbi:MAG: hypothetical protein RLZZ450_6928 [Pseudomonadota bacterium]|jgi:hypothetical protein
MSILSLVASRRLFTHACAASAILLAACGPDASTTDPETTTGREPATVDAGKTSSRPTADAGHSSSQAKPDAGKVPTKTDTDVAVEADPDQNADAQGGDGKERADGGVKADSGTNVYSWPADCEDHHTFRAHNVSGVSDSSKKQVAAGAQYYASYYFRSPWAGQVQGLKFRSIIDNKKIVHHWILYGVDSSTQQDGAVQGGEGQPIGSMQGEFYIAGWAPGAPDIEMPDGVGLHMPTGGSATFRLEVHYFNTSPGAVPEQDASGVEFCSTTKKRPQEAAVHWLGTTNLRVPAGKKTDINSTCKPMITNGPVHLLSLSAHMHTAGVHARAILNRANGGAPLTLLDDSFSFMEQGGFKLPRDGSAPDVQLTAGDSIAVTCSYDNTTTMNKTFGSNTENEMCFFYALAWPRGQLRNGSPSIVPGAEPEVNCIQ